MLLRVGRESEVGRCRVLLLRGTRPLCGSIKRDDGTKSFVGQAIRGGRGWQLGNVGVPLHLVNSDVAGNGKLARVLSDRGFVCLLRISRRLLAQPSRAANRNPRAPSSTQRASALRQTSATWVSRPLELHHRPRAKPSVRLSPHIRQTCRPHRFANVRRDLAGS
jgi:hypothetical protein